MGSYWSFDFHVPTEHYASAAKALFSAAASFGHSAFAFPANFSGERFTYVHSATAADLRFFDQASLEAHIFGNGGHVSLWSEREEQEIGLTFQRETETLLVSSSWTTPHSPPFEDHRRRVREVAAVAERFAHASFAPYGCGADELTWEVLFDGPDFMAEVNAFRADVRAFAPPRALLWWNYFRADYASRLPLEQIRARGLRVREGGRGILVTMPCEPDDAGYVDDWLKAE